MKTISGKVSRLTIGRDLFAEVKIQSGHLSGEGEGLEAYIKISPNINGERDAHDYRNYQFGIKECRVVINVSGESELNELNDSFEFVAETIKKYLNHRGMKN